MKVQIRADGSVEIDGYVNAVGRDSRRIRDEYGNEFVEQIQPGAFAVALNKRGEDKPVKCLLNHNEARLLGDTNTNLKLEEDNIGLHANVIITDAEVIELARAKRLSGWSFGFYYLDSKTDYDYSNHVERSVVTELELEEVSIIDDTMTPVYAGTSIHSRAEEKKEILLRAFDNDVISYTSDTPDKKPEERAEDETEAPKQVKEEPETEVDYTRYHDTINRLRR